MGQSRTILSIKNSIVALGFYFINLVLQFYSRQVFFVELGSEVLGLNTTATSLLQFLNLAELGVGSAIGVTLYKPLHDKNYNEVNEIVSLQGWLYKRIAIFILIGSSMLMCFFPLIFGSSDLPLWYAYASYSVLLFSSILGYFVNYKQIVLSASQQDYFVRLSFNATMIIKVVCQTVALQVFENAYIWWLVLEFGFAIIASITLNLMIRKKCPYLETDTKAGASYKNKYPDVLTKVKQMFFHKASRYALTQTSPLIIYAYASLTLVAIYGNYMLIVTGVTALLTAVFDSMNAGVGNLVAEGNQKRIISVFRELFTSRFLLVSTITYCLVILADPFVSLWIGPDYTIDNLSLYLIAIIFFLNTARNVVDSYISAYGLFQDIYAPIIEASVNIGFSILLGYLYGLPGILGGVVISLLLVVFLWKPYFLFSRGLKEPLSLYVKMYLKHLIIYGISFMICYFLSSLFNIDADSSYTMFIFAAIVNFMIIFSIESVLLYLFEQGMKDFISRFLHIRSRK